MYTMNNREDFDDVLGLQLKLLGSDMGEGAHTIGYKEDNRKMSVHSKLYELSQMYESANSQLSGMSMNIRYVSGTDNTGALDKTSIIQQAISSAPNYSTLIIPQGTHKITSPLVISGKTSFRLITVGLLVTYGCDAYHVVDCDHCEFEVNAKNYEATQEFLTQGHMTSSWALGYAGVQLTRVVTTKINAIQIEGFNKAIFNDGDGGGTSYNKYELGNLINNKYDIYSRSVNGGWVSEFETFGGRLWLNSDNKASSTDTYGYYFEYPPSFNYTNIVLNKPCVETKHNFMNVDKIKNLTLITPRTEGTDVHIACQPVNGAENITWIVGSNTTGGGLDLSRVKLNEFIKGFIIIGGANDNNGTINKSAVMDTLAGGITFINRDSSNQLAHLSSEGNYDARALTFKDFYGRTQCINKQHSSSAIPTTLTWSKGEIVWNSAPASLQPLGWSCNRSGTFGTLTGIKCSTTSGSRIINNITPSTATLKSGDYICCGGHSGSIYQIQNIIDSTSIRLFGNASYTETNVNMTYSVPTFIAMPSYP